ncbi:hypothetical protein EASAB2608_06216 [Streptomyces sp. EAS-AB2608]|nr:hypothetical protein EASAB2608_06216 [Streptomyces sp. EAS-AB2608]
MIRPVADRVRAVLALLGPVGAGSHVLLLRLVGRFGWKPVAVGGLAVVYVAARYRSWVIWLVIGWCAAALLHAPKAGSESADQAEEDPPAEPPEDPLPGILQALIGDAPGVHLKTVVHHLHQEGLDTTCTTADVTAALDRRQIPVRASVRDAAGRVNRGVHRDDLQAWLEARSPTALAPLSKARSNPATTAVTCDVADAATDVATPPTLPN